MFKKFILTILILSVVLIQPTLAKQQEPIATFSIAAFDPATGEVGVAVASRFFYCVDNCILFSIFKETNDF